MLLTQMLGEDVGEHVAGDGVNAALRHDLPAALDHSEVCRDCVGYVRCISSPLRHRGSARSSLAPRGSRPCFLIVNGLLLVTDLDVHVKVMGTGFNARLNDGRAVLEKRTNRRDQDGCLLGELLQVGQSMVNSLNACERN